MSKRVWLITGGARGIGKEIAVAALAQGDLVAATSRKVESLSWLADYPSENVLALALDITNPEQVTLAVNNVIEKFGTLHVLVNNAGYGQFGAIEELSNENIHNQIEANVYGPLYAIRAALPAMRNNKNSHIINLSSIAGLLGTAGLGMYNASKFALEGLSEALALEVKPLGIQVTVIEPGGVRTDFAGDSLQQPGNLIADYDQTRGTTGTNLGKVNGHQVSDPVKVAKAIVDIANNPEAPIRVVLGADALPRIKAKLEAHAKLVEDWEAVSLSVGF
ncbi:MAG: SDR family NAD(P)-dependent oxidoreductase [Chitinophagaceae bacterium]